MNDFVQIAKASGWRYERRGDGYQLLDDTGRVRATAGRYSPNAWYSLVLQAQEIGNMPRWSTDEQAMLRLALRSAERIEMAPVAQGMYQATLWPRHRAESFTGLGTRPALALACAWLAAAGVSIDITPTKVGW